LFDLILMNDYWASRDASGRHADSQVCITFQIDLGTVHFQVAIRLNISDYDDTEMVQAARSTDVVMSWSLIGF